MTQLITSEAVVYNKHTFKHLSVSVMTRLWVTCVVQLLKLPSFPLFVILR